MYGGQEHAAAGSSCQMLSEFVPAFYFHHTFIAYKLLSRAKQFGKLVVQVGTISYQDNRGTGKILAPHQHTAEK